MNEADYLQVIGVYFELFAVGLSSGYLLAAFHAAVKLILPYR